MARLDPSHGGHAADAGKLQSQAVAEAAPPEHDRYTRRVPATRFDAGAESPAESNRRLQSLDAVTSGNPLAITIVLCLRYSVDNRTATGAAACAAVSQSRAKRHPAAHKERVTCVA